MKFFFLGLSLIIAQAGHAELFDARNNPSNFSRLAGTRLTTHYNSLPAQGGISDDRLGWSESYWPSNKGGIAYRWNHPDPQPFKYKLHSKAELMSMSQAQMAQLSPSELYDIANGDYGYSLTRKAFSLYHARDLWWEGICHGWAQAAAHYPEPSPVNVTNKDGITVPFGASDVKALLAMHEAYNYKGETFGFVGARCRAGGKVPGEGDDRDSNTNEPSPDQANSADCKDVNAGAFHVVLGNMLGLLGKAFVADIDRYNDVWNQPITHYSSAAVAEEAVDATHRARGVERRVRVQTKMTYGEELKFWTPELEAQGHMNFVSKLPVTNTPHQKFLSRDYEYIIEINSAGNVIGGEWITQTRPDFLWKYERPKNFKNSPIPLAGLKSIYRPIRR